MNTPVIVSVLLFSISLLASTPTSKVDEFWLRYIQVNDNVEKTFKTIRMTSNSKSAIRKYIDDTKNQEKIRLLIADAWKKEIQKQFTEQEIAYFFMLYSHPLFKKAIAVNDQFWSKDVYKYMQIPEENNSLAVSPRDVSNSKNTVAIQKK